MKSQKNVLRKIKTKFVRTQRYFQDAWMKAEEMDRRVQERKTEDIVKMRFFTPTRFY